MSPLQPRRRGSIASPNVLRLAAAAAVTATLCHVALASAPHPGIGGGEPPFTSRVSSGHASVVYYGAVAPPRPPAMRPRPMSPVPSHTTHLRSASESQIPVPPQGSGQTAHAEAPPAGKASPVRGEQIAPSLATELERSTPAESPVQNRVFPALLIAAAFAAALGWKLWMRSIDADLRGRGINPDR